MKDITEVFVQPDEIPKHCRICPFMRVLENCNYHCCITGDLVGSDEEDIFDISYDRPDDCPIKPYQVSGVVTKIICIDTETTGINPETDEILQLSIIDGNFKILLDEYYKPSHLQSWENAEKINGITPAMTQNKSPIKEDLKLIQWIIDNADVIVTYNGSFDFAFLEKLGIKFKHKTHFDVMKEFSRVHGVWDENLQRYKYQKLIDCAKFYSYLLKAHDSLEDVKATLYCYYKLINETNKKE